jgi:adenylate kinase
MRIVILGSPGSGKKTQAGLLADNYRLTVLTISDLVKHAQAEKNERGEQLRLMLQRGQSPAEDVILELLQDRLKQPDMRNGFILDGFPRNLLQALTLDEVLAELNLPVDFVLLFEIETDALMERLVGRRTCRSCGEVYNIYTHPTAVEDVCDLCGGRLHQRADDTEETVSSRLHVFDHLTAPLLTHYGKQNKVLRVDGEGDKDQVFVRTCRSIDDFLAQRSAPAEVSLSAVTSRQDAVLQEGTDEPGDHPASAGQEELATPTPASPVEQAQTKQANEGVVAKKPAPKQPPKTQSKPASEPVSKRKAASNKRSPKRAVSPAGSATKPAAKGAAKKSQQKSTAKKPTTKKPSKKAAPAGRTAKSVAVKKKVAGNKATSAKSLVKTGSAKKTPAKKAVISKSKAASPKKKTTKKKAVTKKAPVKKTQSKKPAAKKKRVKQVTKKVAKKAAALRAKTKKAIAKKAHAKRAAGKTPTKKAPARSAKPAKTVKKTAKSAAKKKVTKKGSGKKATRRR